MNENLSRMVQDEAVARCAQPPAEQAGLLELMAHFLWAVLQPLATVLQNAIDLRGDLVDKNLVLALMAKSKRGADGERSQVIEAFCNLLI